MAVTVFALLCTTLLASQCLGQNFPFRNTSLPWAQRVDDLVSRLTLEEVQGQLSHGGVGRRGGPSPAIQHLGIGPYSWNTECLRGDVGAGNATSFPQALGLAAAWSQSLIFRVAEATGVEVRAKYNAYVKAGQFGDHKGISCFSPVINIMRDPRWGRSQETYGEDPILSGILVRNFVYGLQGNDSRFVRANAGCKHFDVHGGPENIPVSRFSFDAKVSEQDWRMTFLPAFRSCVKAGTYNLMCSYNRINGIPACANKELLTDILRTEWGFKGYVISDQGAIENIISAHHYRSNNIDTVAACLNAGCNLELGNDIANRVYFSMIDAIKAGKLTEATARASLKPLFYTRMRLGEFDPPATNQYTKLDTSVLQSAPHRALSLEAAEKSFVLLKNTNSFLPLKKNFNKIGVVGPMANNLNQLFGDYSATVNPAVSTTPLQGLHGVSAAVQFGAGCSDNKCRNYTAHDVQTAVTGVDAVFVCIGTGQQVESEGNDRANLDLPGSQLQLLKDAASFSHGAPIVLLVFSGGPVNITWADQSAQVKAILQLFFPAQATGQAIANVLKNSDQFSNPAGRLPYTWPHFASQVPSMTDYSMKERTYRYFTGNPLYPFGYGLSYTTFAYSKLTVPQTVVAGKDLMGSVTVMNSGSLAGDEVYQIYISWNFTTPVPVPHLQLTDFDRIHLPPGASRVVSFSVPAETIAVWEPGKGWVVLPGTYTVYAGGQQPNQKRQVPSNVLKATFTVTGTKFLGRY